LSNTVLFFVGDLSFNLPLVGSISLYTLIVGVLAIIMLIYFMVNTSVQAKKLQMLDEKRLERKLEKQSKMEKKASEN